MGAHYCKGCRDMIVGNPKAVYCSERCERISNMEVPTIFAQEVEIRKPIRKLIVDMSEFEYRQHKAKYGSCMDESRNYYTAEGEVL